MLVERYTLHHEDGAGEFRGGRSVVLDYSVVSDETFLTTTFGRHKFPPKGDGPCNYIKIIRKMGPGIFR